MDEQIERQIYDALTKTIKQLDMMMMSLMPLIEKYREPIYHMPEIPKGQNDCPVCEGHGYVNFIGEHDLWNSRKCECVIDG